MKQYKQKITLEYSWDRRYIILHEMLNEFVGINYKTKDIVYASIESFQEIHFWFSDYLENDFKIIFCKRTFEIILQCDCMHKICVDVYNLINN